MVVINWTDQSINDLDKIGEFIEKDSLKYAKIQVKRLIERGNFLKYQPYLGRMVPEYNDKSIRELIHGNYRIIYKVVSEERIDIITVHHSAKRLRLDLG